MSISEKDIKNLADSTYTSYGQESKQTYGFSSKKLSTTTGGNYTFFCAAN